MPIILKNIDVLQNHEPVRKSWFTLEITDSPVGAMPKDEDFILRNTPPLASRVGTTATTTVNSILNIPSYKEGVEGAFGFSIFSNSQTLKWWQAWMDRVYAFDTDSFGLYSEIVGQGVLSLYTSGGDSCSDPIVIHQIRVIDCWPSEIALGSMDRDNDGETADYTVNLKIADIKFK